MAKHQKDKPLIDQVLRLVQGIHPNDRLLQARLIFSAKDADHVSSETVRKWELGETQRLDGRTRGKVLATLERHGVNWKDVVSRGTFTEAPRATAPPELKQELDRVHALAVPEWHKALLIAELSAAYRAEAMWADARARERDAEAALERARALAADAQGALARFTLIGDGAPGGTAAARGRSQRRGQKQPPVTTGTKRTGTGG